MLRGCLRLRCARRPLRELWRRLVRVPVCVGGDQVIFLVDPEDGGFVPITFVQYCALPIGVAARYLARMSITAALETSRRIRTAKEGKN